MMTNSSFFFFVLGSLCFLSTAAVATDNDHNEVVVDYSQPLCFETRPELDQAVADYLSGDANRRHDVELIYGERIGTWCTSHITDFSRVFDRYATFNEPLDGWDMSQAATLEGMFFGAHLFNQDLSMWNVDNVQDLSDMFVYAVNFSQDLSSWNTSRVTSMRGTFFQATHFAKCSSLLQWDTASVTDKTRMLRGTPCEQHESLRAILGEEAFADERRA